MRYRFSNDKRKKITLSVSEDALDLFSKFNDNKYDSLSDFVETNLIETFDTPESFEMTLDNMQREMNRLLILKEERIKQLELKKERDAIKKEEDRWKVKLPPGAKIIRTEKW